MREATQNITASTPAVDDLFKLYRDLTAKVVEARGVPEDTVIAVGAMHATQDALISSWSELSGLGNDSPCFKAWFLGLPEELQACFGQILHDGYQRAVEKGAANTRALLKDRARAGDRFDGLSNKEKEQLDLIWKELTEEERDKIRKAVRSTNSSTLSVSSAKHIKLCLAELYFRILGHEGKLQLFCAEIAKRRP